MAETETQSFCQVLVATYDNGYHMATVLAPSERAAWRYFTKAIKAGRVAFCPFAGADLRDQT